MTDLAKKPVKICDDRFLLKLTKDKMKAVLQLIDQDSSFNDVPFDEILQEAQDLGVCFGLVPKLPPARGDMTIVASGKPVVHGENAKVKPIIKPAIVTSPKVKKLGKDMVDFRELGNIVNVPSGQLLLQKIAATDGTPGKNVLGEAVSPKPGKDVNIKCGPGALLSDDGMQVTSTLDGKFVMGDGKASVYEEHLVQGDVDISTGNMAFCGKRIEISGEVLSGFKVKCKGDVLVGKGVNNAQILAGGDIVILGGLIGEDAEVRAKGNIKLDFCENTGALEAKGNLTVTNFIVQANVKTGKDLRALEGKGSLIGGKYVLGGSMYVTDLGSDAEVVTEVTVGLKPELEQQKRKIEAAKEYWPNRMSEILKNINALNEMKKAEGKNFSEEKAKVLAEFNKMMPEVMEKNSQLTEMETKLDEEINKAANEVIYVYGTLYPGVRVTIGKASRIINKEEQQVVVELQKSTLTVHVRAMTPEEKEAGEL
ncbi:MAG: FapA family protein [Desulfobulbaceae bacterium]|nr:FapA family protein [Desulfobulbaceae bacterium]